MKPATVLLLLTSLSCAGSPVTRSSTQLEATSALSQGACAQHELHLEPGVTEPKVLEGVQPRPPSGAPAGYACVHATIDVNGRAVDVEVVDTNHPLFAKAFVRALQQWRFQPATREGVPVPIRAHFGSAYTRSF
jgi:hypothetical protein